MHDTARVFSKRPRAFVEEGRPQTEEDVALLPWNERRYLQEHRAGELRLWRPGAKSRSFESGDVFCVRLCPAIPSYTQQEIATMDPAGVPRFLGGRDESGLFTEGLLRRVYVIDNFGFDRKVSFIPSVPYVPAQYEKYSSPSGNPYAILTTTLWRKKASLPDRWQPLVMKTDDLNAYRKSRGLNNRMRTQLLLPLPKERYFGYALIYKGFNTDTEEDFEFEDRPFGLEPEQGLQVVTFNKQVFDSVQDALMMPARPGASEFYYPDPAAPDQGALIYVWNRELPNPINPKAGKLNGFGYAGGVETRYFKSPSKPVEVDLTLPDSFLEHYYENRKPWSSVLRGIYGWEQVRLIAEIAPELKGPCKFAWQNHPELMAVWEDAFRDAPDDCDFYEVLDRVYGNDDAAGDTHRFQDRRSVGSNELDRSNEETRETDDTTPETPTSPVTQPLAEPRSRITTPDLEIPRSRPASVTGTSKPAVKSPIRVVGSRLFDHTAPAGFEMDE